MSFYGRSNRALVETELAKGSLADCQIAECDMDGIAVGSALWDKADLRDLNANDARFSGTEFRDSVFFRASLMKTRFSDCGLSGMMLDGLTLIKSGWDGSCVKNSTIRFCSLQRATFERVHFSGSTLSDFEALCARMESCVFTNSVIEITYGSGMNGFSEALIKNCVFYNCRFAGFPLRGAILENCVFSRCSGEIGDEMTCDNVAGLPNAQFATQKTLHDRDRATALLGRYSGSAP